MKSIIAIDPGTEQSAILIWGGRVGFAEILPNADIMGMARGKLIGAVCEVAIEMIASYGMPVGKSTFETVLVIGRLLEAFERRGFKCTLVYRKEIKLALCGTTKAKDANVSQALRDKYGVKIYR